MALLRKICELCKKEFVGRPNRRTCSVKCRRTLERRRRFWDGLMAHAEFCQLQADWTWLTEEERASWARDAAVERARVLVRYGPRP